MEMAKIGGTAKGGSNRQTLTDVDAEGRALFQRWGEACGLTLSVDRLGNMVFRREGRDPARAPVAIGSHLDTQPTGGKFDGVLGVLAGLEIMRALHEAGAETEAPLLLINWTNEEGARFSPPMMGSGAAMGIFTEAEVLAKRAADGAVFGEELKRIGWQGEADPADLQRSPPIWNCISSRASCWRMPGSTSASSPMRWRRLVRGGGGGRGGAWRRPHGRAARRDDGGGAADRGRRGDRAGDARAQRRAGPWHGRGGRGLSQPPATSRRAGCSSASISATATRMPWPAWVRRWSARAAEIARPAGDGDW